MKRIVLLAVMMIFTIASIAQLSRYARKYEQRVPANSIDNAVMNPFQPFNTTVISKAALEDQLGTTRYDMQTNKSCQNRFVVFPDGTMAGTWIYGMLETAYNDRGTGYNYFDGSSWGTEPSARLETVRTGWPSLCQWNGNGELIVSHNSTTTLVINTRPVKGTGAWTQKLAPATPSGAPALLWPRAITSGTNHQNIHILAMTAPTANSGAIYNGLDGALLYYRSTDGGTTWDINGIQLPGMTSDNYDAFSGDQYTWGTPHGDTIYFAMGGSYLDTFIMESFDNGTTWTKIPILTNASRKIPTTVTDIPPWYSSDGAVTCEMGKNGIIHFASGIGGGDVQAGTKYILINRNGLIYWNTTMPMLKDSLNLDTLDAHGQLAGFYSDGPNAGDTLKTIQNYRTGITSHPQITIDGFGNMCLLWDGITWPNPEPSTGNNFRHLFARTCFHDKTTWSMDQMDLNSDISYIFMEFAFPSMASTVLNDNLEVLYQSANTPGSAIITTTLATKTCNIEHRTIPFSLFWNVPVQNQVSGKSYVGQNFPNPVSGTTNFNVNLEKASTLTIEVYNLTGQKVLTLDKGLVSGGAHQFAIDASQLDAGVYFYTVKINGESRTHKMIVE
jgi:hypothetical protein